MKVPARDIASFTAKPPSGLPGILIFGQDAMRVALRRKALVDALTGPGAEEEMRLTRMAGSDARKDPAQVADALKAVGFFPGPRVVHVDDVTDQAAPGVLSALQMWEDGDATLVVTAGGLKPTSKLRKAFESHPKAATLAIYNDPPSRAEVEAMLTKAGIGAVDRDAQAALDAMARDLDPGDFAQFAEKLALFTLDQGRPVSTDDVDACAPQSVEAGLDDVLHSVAEARTQDLIPLLHRMAAQGVSPTALCIGALRHFRSLHTAASDPGGAAQGVGRLRPPVYGPRRDRLVRQAQGWGRPKLETALGILLETDLSLRSAGQTAPQMAVVERSFIRLSMLGGR